MRAPRAHRASSRPNIALQMRGLPKAGADDRCGEGRAARRPFRSPEKLRQDCTRQIRTPELGAIRRLAEAGSVGRSSLGGSWRYAALRSLRLRPNGRAGAGRQFIRGSRYRQVADRFRKAHPHSREPQHVRPTLRIVHALCKGQAFPCLGAVTIHRIHWRIHQDGPPSNYKILNPARTVFVPACRPCRNQDAEGPKSGPWGLNQDGTFPVNPTSASRRPKAPPGIFMKEMTYP